MKKVLIEISEKEFEHLQSKSKFQELSIDIRNTEMVKLLDIVQMEDQKDQGDGIRFL